MVIVRCGKLQFDMYDIEEHLNFTSTMCDRNIHSFKQKLVHVIVIDTPSYIHSSWIRAFERRKELSKKCAYETSIKRCTRWNGKRAARLAYQRMAAEHK